MSAQGANWNPTITIRVRSGTEAAVSGAVVTGIWTGAVSGSQTCTTTAVGDCTVAQTKLKGTSATFTVTSVTKSGSTYTPAANHDADGDSTGTAITVTKPGAQLQMLSGRTWQSEVRLRTWLTGRLGALRFR